MDTLISFANTLISIHCPRIDRAKKHNLTDIIRITLCATTGVMEVWEEIEFFVEERADWVKGFLELPNGILSHDTIYRVFSRINPKELNRVLIQWTGGLNKSIEGKVVATEQRHCTCLSVVDHLDHVSVGFKDLKTVAKIHSIREIKGKIEEQTRYFICSLP